MDRRIKTIWQVLFLCFTVYFLVERPVRLVRVQGNSMLPTYRHGQTLIGVKFHSLSRGDVVVFHDETGDEMIKRIKYMEGDIYRWAAVSSAEYIYVDEEHLDFIRKKIPDMPYWERAVEKGRIWVLGDNSRESYDSRVYGALDVDLVDYKIIAAL